MSIWVKICGIRDLGTARAVAELGPDAIGLNFYADSARAVTAEAATEIVAVLPESVSPVGVFVNHSPAEVRSICKIVGITTVQIHGDESPDMIAQLDELRVIRAFRVRQEGIESVAAHIEQIKAVGIQLAACLVDAHVPGTYGGTGQSPPWQLLAERWNRDAWPPLILAGGLTPENVGDGVGTIHPWGVDVASGVESSPGEKDLLRVSQFIASARTASL